MGVHLCAQRLELQFLGLFIQQERIVFGISCAQVGEEGAFEIAVVGVEFFGDVFFLGQAVFFDGQGSMGQQVGFGEAEIQQCEALRGGM